MAFVDDEQGASPEPMWPDQIRQGLVGPAFTGDDSTGSRPDRPKAPPSGAREKA
jgi:hypothetical protein